MNSLVLQFNCLYSAIIPKLIRHRRHKLGQIKMLNEAYSRIPNTAVYLFTQHKQQQSSWHSTVSEEGPVTNSFTAWLSLRAFSQV